MLGEFVRCRWNSRVENWSAVQFSSHAVYYRYDRSDDSSGGWATAVTATDGGRHGFDVVRHSVGRRSVSGGRGTADRVTDKRQL